MPETEIVYVCSPNFWRYLFLSLRSLLTSGSHFDRVTIYVVGEAPEWPINDDRIRVKSVPDIGGAYWGTNKVHLCDALADRVVFLDTDTFVLEPLQQLWEGRREDLIARLGVETYTKYWHPDRWQAALESVGAHDYPQYSPGFMIFQNGSHRRIKETWIRMIDRILANQISTIPPNRFAELYAFSIAASLEGLSHFAMEERGHRYAMLGESADDAVVHHLGTPQFYRHYLQLEKRTGIEKRTDISIPRPAFTELHAQYTRVKHRLKSRILGKRDERLEY